MRSHQASLHGPGCLWKEAEEGRRAGLGNEGRRLPDLGAKVSFLAETELALAALRDVQWNDMVTRGNRGDPCTHTLHDPTTLVPQHTREQSLRVVTFQSVGIGVAHSSGNDLREEGSEERDESCVSR